MRLPLKSLIRFKSVSKHWLSLISEPKFHRCHNRILNPISGLFLNNSKFMYSFCTINGEFDYVNLDKSSYSSQPPIKSGDFGESGFRIVQSCNGLFLCSRHLHPKAFGNFVCNPITKKYTPLPRISWHWRDWSGCIRIMNSFSLSLAFDPWESSHYKVVCVRNSDSHRDHYQIQIYSSETRRWWLSGDPVYVDYSVI
ncbi:F-box protein [Morus notabilis]|uniref:F-box protein n=2 Tax=Morus notabilis TaxID=981085 RepID=W9S9I9_9ROSA|nr:F-box protein [Morus notabilis]